MEHGKVVKSEPNDVQQLRSSGGPIVHVRGDSETELDLLFSVLNNDPTKQHRKFSDRDFPPSFFIQPKPGVNHRREGSLDYAVASTNYQSLQGTPAGPTVYHDRSHSSPAKLPVTSLSLPNNSGGQLKRGTADDSAAKYFVNNTSPAWQMSTCKPLEDTADSQKKQSHNAIIGQGNVVQQHTVIDQASLEPLPSGWEQGVTQDGNTYFINHNTKTTSWYDPRLSKNMQRPGASKSNTNLQSAQHGQQPPQLQRQRQQQQHATLPQQHTQLTQSSQLPKQQSLQQINELSNQQFVQQQQQQQQQQQSQLFMKQLPPTSQIRTSSSLMSSNSVADQIRLELQKLQKERERLNREEEEYNHREQLLMKELQNYQTAMSQSLGGTGDSRMPGLTVPQGMQQMNINGVDPFLGQTVIGPDLHARQNSGDSGLGNCYSLPRTPEDFLGNVDALDRHDIGIMQERPHPKQHHQKQLYDFGMSSLGGLDIMSLTDPGEQIPMDSDDLVSTLTDEFGRELLGMDMQVMDILLTL